ncbi:MAG: di-heme oxidoredictase family protein [Rickettsiales bacterium]
MSNAKKILIAGAIALCFFAALEALYPAASLSRAMGNAHRGSARDETTSDSALSGGAATVFNASQDAFAKPLANLPIKDLRKFAFGNKMFNTNWVQAPASVASLDGLGPTFNRVSCSSCHFKDGRGHTPAHPDDPMESMLVRLSVPGETDAGAPMPHPAYGGQLNPMGIKGVPGEGRASVSYTEKTGAYADGAEYRLRVPHYTFVDMRFGELGEGVMFSPRVSPAVHGLGLLESAPEEDILAWADPDDEDGDGISGRPNYAADATGKKRLGRFGWKANVPDLKTQDAGAALGDIGVTSSLHPVNNCPDPQTACKNATNGGDPEMSDEQLEKLTFYSRTLAPPARRDVDDETVREGAALFTATGCASCHRPTMKTGKNDEIPALSDQEIQPFTDMLLHDMGKELSDGRPDFDAGGEEWRTPPLWGIGLTKTVNRHTEFLHDGRARNLEEAILWHGGEGEKAKEKFVRLSKEKRRALIRFLDSL